MARLRAGAAEEGSRCWPFGGEAGALPPMEVRRFRWWADEAALAAEQEEGEAEEERRMAAKRRKRSIVELFATVPRVAGGEGLGRGKRVRRKLDKGELVLGVKTKKKGFKKEKVSIEISVRKKVSFYWSTSTYIAILHCITWICNVFVSDTIECLGV